MQFDERASDSFAGPDGVAAAGDGVEARTASGSSASGRSQSSAGSQTRVTAGPGAAATTSRTGPIKVGIVRTGVSNADAFGVSLGNTVSEADVNDAIIASINEQGGLAGRKLEPVYADTDTASASWDADFAAACASFTQDNKVEVVLGYVFDYQPGFESCLAAKGIPHLSTSFNVPDAKEIGQFPLLFALSTPRIERRSLAKIDGALATGVLTKANRLGVILDSCPGTLRAWNDVTRPYILNKGLTIASTIDVGCAHGSGDAAAAAGQAGNLVLQFRTAQVDRVVAMSVSEGPGVLIIANAAEAQRWHPIYIVSSLANASTLAGQIPPAQAANIHGYGWMPVQDANPPQWPPFGAPHKRCLDFVRKKGVTPTSAADFAFVFNVCDALLLYESALLKQGGRNDGASVRAALESLGTQYASPLILDTRTTYTVQQHDAPSHARYFNWERSCSCFMYRSATVPIP